MHDLRRLYVVLAFRMFDYALTGLTENLFITLVLGHTRPDQALDYNNVTVPTWDVKFNASLRPKLIDDRVTQSTTE